jgi:hypothetical protein
VAFAEDGRHLLALILAVINGELGRAEILVYRAGESDPDD